jgi:hypothetical protein
MCAKVAAKVQKEAHNISGLMAERPAASAQHISHANTFQVMATYELHSVSCAYYNAGYDNLQFTQHVSSAHTL